MSGPFLDTIDSQVPRMAREILAADPTLAAFFGTRIYDHDYQEVGGPLIPPYLAVIPDTLSEKYFPGQKCEGTFHLLVSAYLPRQIPVDVALATPASPGLANGGAGALTGTFTYAVSGFTETGFSYASAPASITLATQKTLLTVPTGSGLTGRILWRSEAGRSYMRYHSAIPDNTTTSVYDELPDSGLGDDLAPDSYLGRRLKGAIKRALMAQETLTFSNLANADMLVAFSDQGDNVTPDRNCRVMVTGVTYQLYYDRQSRYSVLELAP